MVLCHAVIVLIFVEKFYTFYSQLMSYFVYSGLQRKGVEID